MKENKSIAKELVLFALPLIFSGILQQLYSWADAFIVGHSGAEGEMMLAAVGATGSITMLLIHSILGFTVGLSIMAAQEYGRKNLGTIRKISSNFIPVLCGIYTVLAVVAMIFIQPILKIMDTPAEIFAYAQGYLQVVLIGVPFLACYNLFAALFRAVGNTKVAFYAVLLSSVLNVILDVIFVLGYHWGTVGAAAATVISQIAMTIFIVLYGYKKYPDLMMKKDEMHLEKDILKVGTSFGMPPAIQNSVTSVGNLILQNFMNNFGAFTVLAITTAYRVDSIMLLPIVNIGSAISSLVARAEGEGNKKKIRSYLKTGLTLMFVTSLIVAFLMYSFGAVFIGIFGVTGEALEIGKMFFRNLAAFYTLFGVATVLRSVLEGIGDIKFCSMVGIAALFSRILFSYILKPFIANRAIALAEGISWCILLLLMIVRTFYMRKKLGGNI